MDEVADSALEAVSRSIRAMRDDLGAELRTTELARAAHFSRFHYSRVFARVTGTTPGRFLSALRIHEAQRRLRLGDASVSDISADVGFSSVGSFGTRFRERVGTAPSAYRHGGGTAAWPAADRRSGHRSSRHGAGLRMRVVNSGGPVLLGLFPRPVMEGMPLRWSAIGGDGDLVWDDVPAGTWYVLGRPVGDTDGTRGGRSGPVRAGDGVTVRIDPLRGVEPPWLTAVPAADDLVDGGPATTRGTVPPGRPRDPGGAVPLVRRVSSGGPPRPRRVAG